MRALLLAEEKTFEQPRQGFAGKLKHRFDSHGHSMIPCVYDDPNLQDIVRRNHYDVVIFDIPPGLKKKHIESYFNALSRYPLVAVFNSEITDKILGRDAMRGGLDIPRKPKPGRMITRISRDEGTKAIYRRACEMAEIVPKSP